MSKEACILGLDIGGTQTSVVVGDYAGRIHRATQFATRPTRGFEPTFAIIALVGLAAILKKRGMTKKLD